MSYAPVYTSPPPVKYPYSTEAALDDIAGVSYALELFLASKMHESEDYCNRSDERKERLYFSVGYGLIQCVKGMMSYADEDLLAAIGHTKQGVLVASAHRKPQPFFASRLAGYVVSSLSTAAFIRSMTDVQRHAELVYAESLFEKALLGILYSGNWLSFVNEALNMRTTISIYRQLGKYIDTMDEEYTASMSKASNDTTHSPRQRLLESPLIDAHFRSGVYLGNGLSHIILSLVPKGLISLVELFGYGADRALGLELLERVGGWDGTSDTNLEPKVSAAEEGLRRTICDMALLVFHLVLSSFTFEGVDVSVADRVLNWNLKRYPNGVFFLFGAGRLALSRSQPARALEYYDRAREAQTQYRNLQLISYWEESVANLALWNLTGSLECYEILVAEATWSKAIYTYGRAVCLIESADGDTKKLKEAQSLMEKVPNLRQRIAGKSIPLEKFVARKARKYQSQKHRLALPALELAYLFLAIAHAPQAILVGKMLPEVEETLKKLKPFEGGKEKKYEKGHGYWDDYCLARFLEGVCCRFIAYPDPDAILEAEETVSISKRAAEARAMDSFKAVLLNGARIELDHHLVYHTHYELGRLLACQGNVDGARTHLELVLAGKVLEDVGRKGKYSLENALNMRTQAAIEALHQKRL